MELLNAFSPLMLAAAAAAIVVLVLVVVLLLRGQQSSLDRRLDQLEADRQRMLTDAVRDPNEGTVARRQRLNNLAELFDRLKLVSTDQADKTELKLIRAGFRTRDALPLFLAIKIGLTVVGLLLGLAAVYGAGFGGDNTIFRVGYVIGGALLGSMAPDIYVNNIAARRKLMMQRGLPDALDLLVIGAEAGMSLDQSLDRVARELMKNWPALAEELALMRIEMTFLPDRRDALQNFSRRVDLPQARGVVTTMLQSDKYGTSLADSLRVLSSEFRKERLLRAEEKAARLPAVMTVPLILFILPTLMIVLMGPAIIMVRKAF
jgi:tight adherence protein C